jgi:hypothetical protein
VLVEGVLVLVQTAILAVAVAVVRMQNPLLLILLV